MYEINDTFMNDFNFVHPNSEISSTYWTDLAQSTIENYYNDT